jgi:hypothetical protein
MVARFCSGDSSRSLRTPARPATAMPAKQTPTPPSVTRPDGVWSNWLKARETPVSSLNSGGTSVPNAAQKPSASA